MSLQRPTLQGRAGFNPNGFGPGLSAPYGISSGYRGFHNGEDYFWLAKASADRLGISTERSKHVYPVIDGPITHTTDAELGLGLWQQIDAQHRFYWWHLRDRSPQGVYSTEDIAGRMGRTGTSAGSDEHLHTEVRKAPYRKQDRINPAPFFSPQWAGSDGKPIETQDEDEMSKPVGYYAVVDGVPSWMWVNWATGKVFSVHTQAEANHVGSYMGDVGVLTESSTATAGDKYKALIHMAKNILGPVAPVFDTASIRAAVTEAVEGALADFNVRVDIASIAAAVEQKLADDFNTVNENVNKPRTVQ